MITRIRPVILCGGSGTGLWPLSRKSFPKQFVPLIGEKSLLQLTLERVKLINTEVICVASDEHRFLLAESLDKTGVSGTLILEPVGRNTAAAMAAAALNAPPDELLLYCPADHHIPDTQAFAKTVNQGIDAAESGFIVTFGIVPYFPSTVYGYIAKGGKLGNANRVERFVEKPQAEVAEEFFVQGGYLWNAGIFLVRASTLLELLRLHAPEILDSVEMAVSQQKKDGSFLRLGKEAFVGCRSESIDYAVLEKHKEIAVVTFGHQWSDVGSWSAVAGLFEPDSLGNCLVGLGLIKESKYTFIHAPHRPVVALGMEDVLIIDTLDAILVVRRDHAEMVKEIVVELGKNHTYQATEHRRVIRPWGSYDSIDTGDRFQVKRISIKPGASLSLQLHHHRAEHWIVVRGTARVTRGDENFVISENQSTYIPLGIKHRLENPGKTELEIIEVQSGGYLEEDDIVRFDDKYGRN